MEAYAIYSSLRSQLNSNSAALKEVQTTKTGFALCPSSPEALLALEAQKEIISAFFVNCQIERSSRWVSYRVTNVPRKIGQILNGQYSLIPVNPTLLSSEISETTGLKPTSISETTSSAVNPDTPSSSWFVNFPEGMKTPLPIQLRLFAQQAEIRKSCATNLAKARTEGGCSPQLFIGTQETPMAIDEVPTQPPTHEIISPFRSVTPPPRAPTEDPPITARAQAASEQVKPQKLLQPCQRRISLKQQYLQAISTYYITDGNPRYNAALQL
ncbi:hypothetical protein TSTA_081570, partial [Talaromyces stipitatus ATCC 10500]